jgi:methionyl aminopeptidase
VASKITIKTPEEIELMREACRVTARILDEVGEIVKPGVSTEEINTFVHRRTIELGATPSTLNYKGYTKSVCTSVNDVVCHGVPSSYVLLKAGDIINIDATSYKRGFHGDSSRMYLVGGESSCSEEARRLVEVTKAAMYVGINEVKPGARIGNIGAAIQEYIASIGGGYGIVREYTGHGLGREFHEPPQVVHVGRRGHGEVMKPGMTFTVEPMINLGTAKTVLSTVDNWTVRTADGKLSAQWEHTVLVTDDGHEILTNSLREGADGVVTTS